MEQRQDSKKESKMTISTFHKKYKNVKFLMQIKGDRLPDSPNNPKQSGGWANAEVRAIIYIDGVKSPIVAAAKCKGDELDIKFGVKLAMMKGYSKYLEASRKNFEKMIKAEQVAHGRELVSFLQKKYPDMVLTQEFIDRNYIKTK